MASLELLPYFWSLSTIPVFEILTLVIYPTPLVESIRQAVTWSVSSKSGSSSAVRRFSELKDSSFLPKRQSFLHVVWLLSPCVMDFESTNAVGEIRSMFSLSLSAEKHLKCIER